ncbi:STAS domain-containing protein [Sinosporangium siamense]|uniref:Anti-sigma factor antagonist n=1 Tax=Sinosporangium siamense TaxID=1367973 RepID=A0A919RI47_9ACTN|nr:STAS domain-containing protein [Sinosporangium siamense]GII94058.1 anti-sigma factor antagonist [Sinosporangium siamense]
MTPLALTLHTVEHAVVLRLSGELDHHTAPLVLEKLKTITLVRDRPFILDLDQLTFCDSSGIAALIAARNHAIAATTTLALVAVPHVVSRTFRLTGLDRILDAYPTVEAAAQAGGSVPS